MNPPLPQHLVPVVFPGREPVKEAEQLLDTTIRYRDPKSKKVMSCTIDDYVTSHRRGELYVVTYDDGGEVEVSERKMQEMLRNRVD
jgi:hypothetical protein